MNKPPITVLENLQSNLNDGVSSWDNRLTDLIIFATKDLESVIEGVKQMVADYETRLAMRDEEIKELMKHVDNETFFNRLADGFEQLEHNAKLEMEIAS